MEKSVITKQLLSRFGSAHLILVFLGSYFCAHLVMTRLDKKIRNAWNRNEKAYVQAFLPYARHLKIKDFTRKEKSYLLRKQRYRFYVLNVTLSKVNYQCYSQTLDRK